LHVDDLSISVGSEVEIAMNVLVLDTSTDQPVLGLLTETGDVHAPSISGAGRHGRDLIPSVRDLLRGAGLHAADLRVVAVGLGPGSYTGLRIGLTAAKTLVYATGADLIGLDSLELCACTCPSAAARIHVVADAQRGDVYAAEFLRTEPHGLLQAVVASRLEPLADWASRLRAPALVVGPGLASTAIRSVVAPELEIAHAAPAANRARAALELARRQWSSGVRFDHWTLEPKYFRRSAAEDQWDSRSATPP
jgi:tRNA threonylcarbamoyladenosine biosynthesis protein TsaB